jgi:hypothetical protein
VSNLILKNLIIQTRHMRRKAFDYGIHCELTVYREHVYRRHALPICCPRCGTAFETEIAMKAHSQQLVPCEIGQAEEADGYNKEQEIQLKGRKRPADQTEVDRWFAMYTILFPNDPPISVPTPCKNDSCRFCLIVLTI